MSEEQDKSEYHEFIVEFTRVLKKAERFKKKFGVDFALGWYLGKMITPKRMDVKT